MKSWQIFKQPQEIDLFDSRRKGHVHLHCQSPSKWNLLPHRKSGWGLQVPLLVAVDSLCSVPRGSVFLLADSLWERAASTLAATPPQQHLKNFTAHVQVLTTKISVSNAAFSLESFIFLSSIWNLTITLLLCNMQTVRWWHIVVCCKTLSAESEDARRYSAQLDTPDRRSTFAERLRDALCRETRSTSSIDSSYAVGISVTGSGLVDGDIRWVNVSSHSTVVDTEQHITCYGSQVYKYLNLLVILR